MPFSRAIRSSDACNCTRRNMIQSAGSSCASRRVREGTLEDPLCVARLGTHSGAARSCVTSCPIITYCPALRRAACRHSARLSSRSDSFVRMYVLAYPYKPACCTRCVQPLSEQCTPLGQRHARAVYACTRSLTLIATRCAYYVCVLLAHRPSVGGRHRDAFFGRTVASSFGKRS